MGQTRVPGTRRWKYGLVSAALGLVVAFIGTVVGWPTFRQIMNAPTSEVPGTFERDLEPGVHLVSVLTTRSQGSGPVTVQRTDFVDVRSVSVQGPDGREVELRNGGNETVTRGNNGFSGVVRFTAHTSGTYTIDMRTAEATEALVTPSITGLSARTWLGVGAGAIGTGLLVLGLVMAGLGWFKKREPAPVPSYASSVAAPPPPPPGFDQFA